ncbi:uncharacterized protein LOC118424395 [Branchiostoma floridae]|uniref:Uncharacterized protein LOC118424395 n=1 Tax=Branchiostoma floridae TaxID=7739 RepID=A0A9J7N3K9_BRAFL|nr:uncharacterized protein LOC118424395 [Branchiostoma floridae]
MDAKVDLSAIAEEDVERFLFCAESRTDTPPPRPAGLQTAKRRRTCRRGPISSKASPWRRKMLRQGVSGKMTVRDGLSRIKTLVPYVAEQPTASASDMSELEIIHSATRYITELEGQLLKLRTGKTGGRRFRNASGSPSKRWIDPSSATVSLSTHKIASPTPSPLKKTERCPKARKDMDKKEIVKNVTGFPGKNYFNVPDMEEFKPGEEKIVKEDLTLLMSLDNGVDSCSSSDSVSSTLAAGAEGVDCGQLLRETDVLLFPDTFFTQLNELLPKDLNTPSNTVESPTDTTFPVQGEEERRILGELNGTPQIKTEYVFEDGFEDS